MFRHQTLLTLKFILRQDEEEIDKAVEIFIDITKNDLSWYVKLSGYQMILRVKSLYQEKGAIIEAEISKLRVSGKEDEAFLLETKLNHFKMKENTLNDVFNELKEDETDKQVLQYIRN